MRLPSLLGSLLIVATANALFADDATPEQIKHFESKVRPLLVARCFGCHGPEKQKSGLRLDSRDAILAGGESGPAFDSEQPANSLLIEAIRYESLQMPPDRKLPDAEIEILTDWFQQGAPWPGASSGTLAVRKRGLEITDEDRKFWSFQPVQRPAIPTVNPVTRTLRASGSLCRSFADPIDAFVIQKLEERGLAPSPVAGRRELIRRLSFDLLGLPPSPEEVDRFVADNAPDAVERLVDEYLSRPEYGERWGRHWLDLVRFAQSNGYERDDEKPNAWRYRDYVIQSLNEDKPYDQFLREQLAGDELDQLTDAGRIALGFYRLGVWDDEPDDERQADFDELDDMLSTTGSVFLGLTIGCARCHDHKFDPIAQDDYYSLLAFLRNVKPYTKPESKPDGVIFGDLATGGKALTVFDSPEPLKTHVLARGSAASPGKEVEPRFLKVLSTDPAGDAPTMSVAGLEHVKSSGRRRALAEWIASDRHPLTARVIVNRLWHYHFGRGLVPTPNDFGHTGLPPTHPELLDYLASELVANGWHLKPLHRQIVLSATYRQSSAADNAMALAVDPANNFLWRQNLRRLEAEAIRDAILATTGSLNRQMIGRGIFPQLPPEVLATQSQPGRGWDQSSPAERARRSVYIFSKRTLGVPILESFDQASADSSQAARNTTTIAPQALILLNSQFTDEQSQAFADRLRQEVGDNPHAIVERAFRLALGRLPSSPELQTGLSYLDRQRAHFRDSTPAVEVAAAPPPTAMQGWTTYRGDWSLREDGGYRVAPHPGAKSLWNDLTFADGEVTAEVWVGEGQDAGLLIRAGHAADGVDAVRAYNINFATGAGRLRLGKHLDNWRSLAEVRAGWKRGAWQQVRVVATGPRLQIYLNGSKDPLIDYTDPEPLLSGQIGFRTFQADAAVRSIHVQPSTGGRIDIPLQPTTAAVTATNDRTDPDRRALAAFCKVLLNLNEFVYVD